MTIEIRSLAGPGDIDATDEGIIFGLAIPYNRETVIGNMEYGGFREKVAPGSCTKSIREADIVALFNHNSGQPLGRTSAGNLALKNTTRGIEPELDPVDTSYGSDLAKLVKSKVIRGWSFGFEVVKDEWTDDNGNESDCWTGTNRTIREMKLIEVSPVTFPAYEMTSISSRDAIEAAREGRGEKRGGNAPGDGSKPYGDVTYADPGYQEDGKKRYPLDTAKHVKAALAYISKAKNAAAYTAKQLASIKARIKAAAKKFGITVSEENEAELVREWRIYLKAYSPEEGINPELEERAGDAAAERKKMHASTRKRIPQIVANLNQALQLFGSCDVKSLPDDAQQALALVSSAAEHAGHVQDDEKLDASDAISDDDANGRSETTSAETRDKEQPKPDDSTSTGTLDDNALRLAYAQALSREIALDI